MSLADAVKNYVHKNQLSVNRKTLTFTSKLGKVVEASDIVEVLSQSHLESDEEIHKEINAYTQKEVTRLRAVSTDNRVIEFAEVDSQQLLFVKLTERVSFCSGNDDKHMYYAQQYTTGEWGIDFSLDLQDRTIKMTMAERFIKRKLRERWIDQKHSLIGKEAKDLFAAHVADNMHQFSKNQRYVSFKYTPYKPPSYMKGENEVVNEWVPPDWYKYQNKCWPLSEPPVQLPEKMSKLGQKAIAVFNIFPNKQHRDVVMLWLARSLGNRNHKFLCLFGASGVGKSTILEYFMGALHGQNYMNTRIEVMMSDQFESGALAQKTFLNLSEGSLRDDHLNFFKDFVTNPRFRQRNMFQQIKGDVEKLFNGGMSANPKRGKDIYSILPNIPEIMGRVIIPKIDDIPLIERKVILDDGEEYIFTREDIRKFEQMSLPNPTLEQRVATIELANYLKKLEAANSHIDIDDAKYSGYLDSDDEREAFVTDLCEWEKMLLVELAKYIHGKREKVHRRNKIWFKIPFEFLNTLPAVLNGNQEFLERFRTETKLQTIAKTRVHDWFNGETYFKTRIKNASRVDGLLNVEAFTQYLIDIESPYAVPKEQEHDVRTDMPTIAELKYTPPTIHQEPKITDVQVLEQKPTLQLSARATSSIQEIDLELHRFCYIDFEYQPTVTLPKLVCAVLKAWDQPVPTRYWLWNDEDKESLVKDICVLATIGGIFVPFCVYLAEASCFEALGLNSIDFKWLDPYILGLPYYRSQTAHDKMETKDQPYQNKMNGKSMLDMVQFFCKKPALEDKVYKKRMIDTILSLKLGSDVSSEQKAEILTYCESDVTVLPELLAAQLAYHHNTTELTTTETVENFINFSRHAVEMRKVSLRGIPLNRTVYEDYIQNHDKYLDADFSKCPELFDQVGGAWLASAAKLEKFLIKHNLLTNWPRTKHGYLSTARELFKPFIQMLKQNQTLPGEPEHMLALYALAKRTRQQRSGFGTTTDKPIDNSICDGQDGYLYQHANFGPYGTKTGRNHPLASTCVLQIAKDIGRNLIEAPMGQTLLKADFEKQEVWVAAVLSGDKALLKDVLTTDIYTKLGKMVGLIPESGNKTTHAKERGQFKTAFLAMQYGCGAKVFADGAKITEDEARNVMAKLKAAYPVFWNWQNAQRIQYTEQGFLMLKDGWFLADEEGYTTTGNFPVQGSAAMLLRKIVELTFRDNINLIYTLHDEFGILCPTEKVEEEQEKLLKVMQEACAYYFPNVTPCGVEFK